MHVIRVAHKAGFLTRQTQSNLHVRLPSRHQQNLHQEVHSPPHNNSAIIDTVYLPGIGTSSLSPNISLSILIDILRRTSHLNFIFCA